MRIFWEKIGVLGPTYHLVGLGLNDRDIADRLNLAESKVESCISWMLHFLKMASRAELVLYASPATRRVKVPVEGGPLQPHVLGMDKLEVEKWLHM